jgi:hypothetical protein
LIKTASRWADNRQVTRTFGLTSLLLTLAIVALAWSRSAQDTTQASLGTRGDAAKVTAAFNLQQAAPALELYRATNGTYAGATLPPSTGVTVVRADSTTFCLQAGTAPNVEHLVGPTANAPVDGPC